MRLLTGFQLACAVMLSAGLAVPVAAELAVKKMDLDVRLDPPAQTVYVKATITLQNRGVEPVEIVELEFPPPVGARVGVNAVWDRRGEMDWRSDEEGSADLPRTLLLAPRSPLRRGKKLVVVADFELRLEGYAGTDGPAVLTGEQARLSSTGWYPQLAGAKRTVPQRLRLTVRLPNAWQVSSELRLKPLGSGTTLAGYELDWKDVRSGVVLLRAWPRSHR